MSFIGEQHHRFLPTSPLTHLSGFLGGEGGKHACMQNMIWSAIVTWTFLPELQLLSVDINRPPLEKWCTAEKTNCCLLLENRVKTKSILLQWEERLKSHNKWKERIQSLQDKVTSFLKIYIVHLLLRLSRWVKHFLKSFQITSGIKSRGAVVIFQNSKERGKKKKDFSRSTTIFLSPLSIFFPQDDFT